MKKFLSLILALALVMSLGTVAFAEDLKGNENQHDLSSGNVATQEVNATVKGTDEPTKVYLITVTFPTLENVKYTFAAYDGWDTTDLEYKTKPEGSWTGLESAEIKISNKSNAAVDVTASWGDKQSGYESVEMTFTPEANSAEDGQINNKTLELKSAENTTARFTGTGTERQGKFTMALTGEPQNNADVDMAAKIGTITITVADHAG